MSFMKIKPYFLFLHKPFEEEDTLLGVYSSRRSAEREGNYQKILGNYTIIKRTIN